ncbi:TauD/TfdA family dioxygenase [Phenylobacterium montanum]|uniref:TauD/TfdA family dioxygenase n=1 Tax=Phenylobacterium montanum TaxID=2823693 RepID=A0A975FWX1_9CAUL|nr:TauD/TfdA family dioxygenase [Caulobacter sp. S6]QUD86983.1 TauD/TfdA family dioxygenase [Caulobacter sp. S6]
MTLPAIPIITPAAWLGPEMRERRDWIYRLCAEEADELKRAAKRLAEQQRPLDRIAAADQPLPLLAPRLKAWLAELEHGRGFVLVRGVPVEQMSEEEASIAYWLMGLHLGAPKPQNSKGELLGHVRDLGDDPNTPGVRLYRTHAKQDFHTDGADIIGLLCLKRSKSGGLSRIVSSISVFNEVARRRPDLAPLLFEDFHWDFEIDAAPGLPRTLAMPICRYDGERLRTFFIGWYIRNAQRFPDVPRLTPAQHELLDLVEAVANDPALYLDMDFEPGDVQFLYNASILHARTEYEDWDEPERKRHLLRLWLTV